MMPEMTAMTKFWIISACHLLSPVFSFCTPGILPAAMAFMVGRASILAMAWLVTMPGARSAPTTMRRRSEEHTSELQSLMRISYAVFCLKKKTTKPCTNNLEQPNEQHNLTPKYILFTNDDPETITH